LPPLSEEKAGLAPAFFIGGPTTAGRNGTVRSFAGRIPPARTKHGQALALKPTRGETSSPEGDEPAFSIDLHEPPAMPLRLFLEFFGAQMQFRTV
jgi:hypothetical protein